MNQEIIKKEIKERVGFELPSINGDQQIYLGQSIIALIALNQSLAYSEEMNSDFVEDLFVGLIDHFKIDYKTLYEKHLLSNVLDRSFDYELEVIVDYKVITQKEY